MPARDWAAFLRAHCRPHLLVVDLGTPSGSLRGKRLFAFLGELTRSMKTKADYSVCCDGQEVKVAFENDVDAKTLGNLLMARVVALGGEGWASKSVCDLSFEIEDGATIQRPSRPNLH